MITAPLTSGRASAQPANFSINFSYKSEIILLLPTMLGVPSIGNLVQKRNKHYGTVFAHLCVKSTDIRFSNEADEWIATKIGGSVLARYTKFNFPGCPIY